MIISKISGGLGNQMFQYAAGKALALKLKTNLKLDISGYAEDKFGRHYSLDIFNIQATLATPLDCLIGRLFRTYINGYWQNEKYFKNYEKQVRKDFTFRKKVQNKFIEKIKSSNSVGVHVRRADYVNISRIRDAVGVCGVPYYKRAINFMAGKVRNPVFFIFSEQDGLKWAREKLNVRDAFMVDGKDYEDLFLMSLCKHNIVANSSFSWWGAWLNKNPEKIVIAPDPWFTNEPEKDIIPSSWVKVSKD